MPRPARALGSPDFALLVMDRPRRRVVREPVLTARGQSTRQEKSMPAGSPPARLFLAVCLVVAACAAPAPTPVTTVAPAAAPTAAPATPKPAAGAELTVFAAASLTEPFNELGPRFGAVNGGAKVVYNFGGTPALRAQLEQGARGDVFASANREQMDAALKSGVVVGETPVLVQNKLVVIVPKENPGKVERLEDLGRAGLKIVTTARTVPVGQYTQDALAKMAKDARFGADFQSKVTANVRSEEPDVKLVVAKVRLGEADAAVVYATDVSPAVAADVTSIAIPDEFNTVAEYPIGSVKDARQPELAKAFIAYLVSGAGRDVMKKFSFIVPEKSALGRVDLRL
jgi:molybdate transport system substrate-binding protein